MVMARFGKACRYGAVLLLVGAVTSQPARTPPMTTPPVTTAATPGPPATSSTRKPPPAHESLPVREPARAQKFSIVVIPDTQYSSMRYPAAFKAQTTWIRNHRVSRNIEYVLHEGDIVDNSGEARQWSNANAAMRRLDGNTPYILAAGNHDLDAMPHGRDPAKVRDATAFNRTFPVGCYSRLPSFGASYPAGRDDNRYDTFTAGGTDWLVLSLKFAPTGAEIAWGDRVIAAHPRHQVMILTHAYQNGSAKDGIGKILWTRMVSRHPNVSFVFSGHYTNQGLIVQKGTSGNTVYQVEADYQDRARLAPNSYLRLVEFDPAARTVTVHTYSPYLNRYLTDARNQFVLTGVAFLPAPA
jgi:calcineurin-like phosphoesterase family protein